MDSAHSTQGLSRHLHYPPSLHTHGSTTLDTERSSSEVDGSGLDPFAYLDDTFGLTCASSNHIGPALHYSNTSPFYPIHLSPDQMFPESGDKSEETKTSSVSTLANSETHGARMQAMCFTFKLVRAEESPKPTPRRNIKSPKDKWHYYRVTRPRIGSGLFPTSSIYSQSATRQQQAPLSRMAIECLLNAEPGWQGQP